MPHRARTPPRTEHTMRLFPALLKYWRIPEFSRGTEPTFQLRFERDSIKLAFISTMTIFQAPQNIALEDLQIETYYPVDEATELVCAQLAT